jgi:SAM-dependent methyltransferase
MNAWEVFFEKSVREIFTPGARILDIGGGLRIDRERGNVEDPKRAWIKPLIASVTYEVLDPVPTYHPDIVGDVMAMPCADASYDAIICLAVLEHVSKPWLAAAEMHRVLKPGGKLLVYVPFLYPYHAMPGYYGDYFRYTEEGIRSLFDAFSSIEAAPVRGPAETLANLVPGKAVRHPLQRIARWLDGVRPSSGKQVSGFNILAKK